MCGNIIKYENATLTPQTFDCFSFRGGNFLILSGIKIFIFVKKKEKVKDDKSFCLSSILYLLPSYSSPYKQKVNWLFNLIKTLIGITRFL